VTTTRLEAFSDGVLAIAITLLVIEIRPPELHQGERLAHALWAQWPSYVAYLVSFLQYTVPGGGKSRGSSRQAQPERTR
jgi:uncharacterized membrane protein